MLEFKESQKRGEDGPVSWGLKDGTHDMKQPGMLVWPPKQMYENWIYSLK